MINYFKQRVAKNGGEEKFFEHLSFGEGNSFFFVFRKLHIDSAPFHSSKRVEQLINDVETLYTDTLESGNRARAMKRLRVPPLEEKQSPSVTFRVGIFIGKNIDLSRKKVVG